MLLSTFPSNIVKTLPKAKAQRLGFTKSLVRPTSENQLCRLADTLVGVLCHELVHTLQHDAKGQCNGGLIEGIADFVRLRAGLAADHWSENAVGDKWDCGYE
jgi:hypothetical protein